MYIETALENKSNFVTLEKKLSNFIGANTSPVANCKSTRTATHQGKGSSPGNDETFAA